MNKRTPLYATHVQLGGRLIEFGGWEMPVQYSGIVEEHQAVRTAAGLFDISHMGDFRVRGPAARDFLNLALTNDLGKLVVGLGQYTLMCHENGGVVDDLYVFCLDQEDYWLVVNASRAEVDFTWITDLWRSFPRNDSVGLENVSDQFGSVAIQGPRVAEFIDACFLSGAPGEAGAKRPTDLRKNQIGHFQVGPARALVSRTGYTGEDGFEVIAPAEHIAGIWDQVTRAGESFGLKPAGLGARDTLRTEACSPLYGHELDDQTSPLEAGLERFVAFNKPDFVGRKALWNQANAGMPKRCVAFQMTDKSAPPRPSYPVWSHAPQPQRIGVVVSGTQSPSLGRGIGLAYVPPALANPGTLLHIEIRGKMNPAIIATKPLYRKNH
jgi:aminomethyltransferase